VVSSLSSKDNQNVIGIIYNSHEREHNQHYYLGSRIIYYPTQLRA